MKGDRPTQSRAESLGFALAFSAMLLGGAGCATDRQERFESPEKAMAAIGEFAKSDDRTRAEMLFGVPEADALSSGDEVADRQHRARFLEMLEKKLAFEDRSSAVKIALLGEEAWPFAFPLVRDGDRWRFDGKAGLEELFSRRVGRNEILTLATLRAYVEAQREYSSQPRDGKPPAFAGKFGSSPALHDGLFWEAAEGEPESPLGPLAARAAVEGYPKDAPMENQLTPYHGYHYRILTAQGKNAPGGERSYLDAEGRLTDGFAAIAWPAKYGNSGIKTFQVNAIGVIFEKDFGEETAKIAESLTVYDPDGTWTAAGD